MGQKKMTRKIQQNIQKGVRSKSLLNLPPVHFVIINPKKCLLMNYFKFHLVCLHASY